MEKYIYAFIWFVVILFILAGFIIILWTAIGTTRKSWALRKTVKQKQYPVAGKSFRFDNRPSYQRSQSAYI